jgi:hypothetical protein
MIRGVSGSRRGAVAATVAALVAPGAAYALGRDQGPTQVVPVALGDVVKVNGAPIGCLARMQNGYRALDCRRAGPLAGTYGSILTSGQLMVVHYNDSKSGTIVFTAHHRSNRVHTCGG